MKQAIYSFFLLILSSVGCIPAFAGWGSDVMSIDAVKYWAMDDRLTQVQGTIIASSGSDGFTMTDDTGNIFVRFANQELSNFSFQPGMRVEIRGIVEHHDRHWDLLANAIKVRDDLILGR